MALQTGGGANPEPQKQHVDNPDEQLKEAREKIISAFEAKRIDFKNSHSQATNDGVAMELTAPIDKVGRDWKAARDQILAGAEDETKLLMLQKDNKERLESIVKLVEAYINDVAAKHGGWLDAAAMAEISSSINSNAALYTHLLIYGNPKIFKVMQVIMGGTAEGKSHSEEIAATLPVLAEMATHEMTRGDRGIMPCIWVLANFLTRPQRIQFAELYAQGKTTQQVEEFLRYGNARGVLSASEMQIVMAEQTKNPAFKFADEKALTQIWSQANDLQSKIGRLEQGTYGSQNDAHSMINYKNALILAGQIAAGATVGGNLLFGIWNGGKLKDPKNLVMAVTNPIVWYAGAAYKGLGMLRKNERIDKSFEGSETAANNKRREALRLLNTERNGNVQWPDWEAFFASNGKGDRDFSGAKVFFDFLVDAKKRAKSDDLPEGEMSTSKFLDYLEAQAKNPRPDKKNIDYKGLFEQFKQISPPSILAYAKAFDTLEIGGDRARQKFESTMKQLDQA